MAQTTYQQTQEAFQSLRNTPLQLQTETTSAEYDYICAYNSAHRTFLDVLNKPIKPSLKDIPVDKTLRRLLLEMPDKIGKEHYVSTLFKQHFNKTNPTYFQSEAAFRFLLQTLLKDFLDTQYFDFIDNGYRVTENSKQTTLARWKRLINRFANKHHLSLRISWRNEITVELEMCEDLISQLNRIIANQQNYFKQLDRKPGARDGRIIQATKKLDINLKKIQKKQHVLKWLKEQLKYDQVDLDNLLKYFNDNEDIVDAIKSFREKRSQERKEALTKSIKNYQDQLLSQIKALTARLTDTLDATFVPYVVRRKPYELINVDENFREYKKSVQHVKAKVIRPTSKATAIVLGVTQASICLFAGIFYFPLVGSFALPLGVCLFVVALVVNYLGFNAISQEVLNLFIIKRDFWVGFKSTSGKLFMCFVWGLAFIMGITLSIITALTVATGLSALAMSLPMLAPVLLGAFPFVSVPLCIIIFVFTTLFFFISMTTLIKGFYSWLEKRAPKIAAKGGGVIQLVKGLRGALNNYYQKTKIQDSLLLGLAYKIEVTIKQVWRYYWSNPTGVKNDPDRQSVWRMRLTHLVGSVMKAIAVTLAIGVIALGAWILFNAWHIELSTLVFGITQAIDVGLAFAFAGIFTCTAFVKSALTFNVYCEMFIFVAELTHRIIDKLIINPVTLLLHSPTRFWKEIVVSGVSSINKNIKEFIRDFNQSPKRAIVDRLQTVKKAIIALFTTANAVAGLAVFNAAIITPNLSVNEVFTPESTHDLQQTIENPPQKYINLGAYIRTAISTPGQSFSAEEINLEHITTLPDIPLNEVRDKQFRLSAHLPSSALWAPEKPVSPFLFNENSQEPQIRNYPIYG